MAAATRAWVDDFRETLIRTRGEEDAIALVRLWGDAFPAAYRDDFDAAEAIADLVQLERSTRRGRSPSA